MCQLLSPDMADKSVPGPLIQEVRQLCRQTNVKPQEFGELRGASGQAESLHWQESLW